MLPLDFVAPPPPLEDVTATERWCWKGRHHVSLLRFPSWARMNHACRTCTQDMNRDRYRTRHGIALTAPLQATGRPRQRA